VGAAAPPTLPPIPGVTVAPGSSQRSEFSFVNGQQSSRLIYEFQLVATQPGDIVIPAIQGRAGGAVLTSRPLALKIVKAEGAAAAAQAALTNLAFLRLIVPKTEVYFGEPFAVEMQLYWQTAQEVHVPQLKADGFSLGPMPKPTQNRTQVGNSIYNLVVCRLTATAARTGTLPFGPAESALTILVPITNPVRTRDPFGFFGRGPEYQQRPTVLKSDAVTMRVLPLPKENVPAGFNGAIGNYRMTASAGPTNLIVGDPITVRVQIAGNGPIESLQLPAQTDWREFTTYPATSKTDLNDPLGLGLSGIKSFEQVVIPQHHEIQALPPLRFSFFDPQAKAYRTLSSPAVPLDLRPAATAVAPPPALTNASAAAAPPPADDIVHIRPR
ncbi:MAG: BatD family protein, partial [Dongiaceae bacterium]